MKLFSQGRNLPVNSKHKVRSAEMEPSRMREGNTPLISRYLVGKTKPTKDFYLQVLQACPMDLIDSIKEGIRPALVRKLARDLQITETKLLEALGIPRSTFSLRLNAGRRLPPSEGQSIVDMARLIGEAQRIMKDEGGRSDSATAAWLGEWIRHPSPALGGRCPTELLDTAIGQQQVMVILQMMQSGAYA